MSVLQRKSVTERNIYVAIATATLLVASGFPVCIVQFVHKAFVVLQGRETNSIYIIRSHPHPTPTPPPLTTKRY